MRLLNPGYESRSVGGSLYYNSSSGKCYYSRNNRNIGCDFTSDGLKANLKALIDDVLWNTGSNGTNSFRSASTGNFYDYERSSNTGKICTSKAYCTDTVTRTTTWQGKVGLMYPSDFGYATTGGTSMNRTSCLDEAIHNWNTNYDCYGNNWLYDSNYVQWSLTPFANSSRSNEVFSISLSNVSYDDAYVDKGIRPSVYVISKTMIVGGEGTSENPYKLSVQ